MLILWEFYTVYLVIFPSLSSPPRSSPTFLPFQVHILSSSFSLQPKQVQFVFVLADYSWLWGLPCGVIIEPDVTSLKRTDSSSSSHQMPVAPPLGAKPCTHLPSFMLGFCLVWDPSRSYSCCHNSCELIRTSALLCPENTVFLTRSLCLVGRGIIQMFHLGLATPKSPPRCMLTRCWFLC